MNDKKINLVSADMGYGHQRAAYPLSVLANNEIITMNDYPGIPEADKKYWTNSSKLYDRISRLKKIPLAGELVFSAMDQFQKIKPFYPDRDLSRPSTQQVFFQKRIEKGLGKNLIEELNKTTQPLVTTFFVAMYAAEEHQYKNDIYAVVCDADVSRAWAPFKPASSRVKFFAPNKRVKERLEMYGVDPKRIIITGFPLPKENIGKDQEIIKADLSQRIYNLDVERVFLERSEKSLLKKLPELKNVKRARPIQITYAVGGAGAQKEIGAQIINSLSSLIKKRKFIVNLVAGIRPEVAQYFEQEIKRNDLILAKEVNIIYQENKLDYFAEFNKVLRKTDILWTKPSELSFYAGLGLPIIMAETIGSQEVSNKAWLEAIGAGYQSLDPSYTHQWLIEMLANGRLTEMALNGYLNAETMGTYNIEEIFTKK